MTPQQALIEARYAVAWGNLMKTPKEAHNRAKLPKDVTQKQLKNADALDVKNKRLDELVVRLIDIGYTGPTALGHEFAVSPARAHKVLNHGVRLGFLEGEAGTYFLTEKGETRAREVSGDHTLTMKDTIKKRAKLIKDAEKRKNKPQSGVPGITWNTRAQRWCVQARIGNATARKHLGRFLSVDDAIAALEKARANAK